MSESRPLAVRQLGGALARGRVAHAYCVVGTAGQNPGPFALELARALLCPDAAAGWTLAGQTSPAPGAGGVGVADGLDPGHAVRCPVCRAVLDERHPDLVVVRPPGRFLIRRQAVEAGRAIRLRPATGPRRVALLLDAHAMTAEAAAALLKVLEEPPAYGVFVLTTRRLAALPTTIVSRCQVVRLTAPGASDAPGDGAPEAERRRAARTRLAELAGISPYECLRLAEADSEGGRAGTLEWLEALALGARLRLDQEPAAAELLRWVSVARLVRQAQVQVEANVQPRLALEGCYLAVRRTLAGPAPSRPG